MRKRLALPLLACAVLSACFAPGPPLGSSRPIGVKLRTRKQFESGWRRYLRLSPPKSLAVAGNLDGVYVSGLAYDHDSTARAVEAAIEYCEQRRIDRRIEDDCTTYAIDDEIVKAPFLRGVH